MSFSYSKKHKDNYSTLPEKTILKWIMDVTGVKGLKDVAKDLKSGVVLCKLMNKVKPKTIKKIHKSTIKMFQMENISFFIRGAKKMKVPESDMFSCVDLFDASNIPQVLLALESFSRCSRNVKSFKGPYIGAKMSKKNIRKGNKDRKGEGSAESMWETKMKKAHKKAKVSERVKHNIIKNSEDEKQLYKKKYKDSDY